MHDTNLAPARWEPTTEQLITLPGAFTKGVTAAPRHVVEKIIEELIGSLDAADRKMNPAEDDFGDFSHLSDGPGCIYSDPDCCDDADKGEATDAEDDYGPGIFANVGPGCPLSDPGGTEGGYWARPRYGVDQSAGPIGTVLAGRRAA